MENATEEQPQLPAWVAPGGRAFELHCTERLGPRRPRRVIPAPIRTVTKTWVVCANDSRYRVADLATDGSVTHFYRDDPKADGRWFLLVGPDDSRVNPEGA
ncbi:hypothetical protein [Nocardia aurea]|jgi:hypothetical protein|uniref:hypothetical protein n=1 Tax=Nocardia aurea TaxID=2144174 RepID=UPI0033A45029